ncbi:putative pentatricopeptide repeat-containing protein [Hibiscus syriacus]|uniref:Pentatricopeptide repeat-containing protein n=1 Tax=Hibiscus syriacus TaxID=106335 RepID=A0A6A3AMD1_HIBSY|nr:uncharacterized protein LOC120124334 [Hibiscus syriacus]KAE8705764.1 putative pentatricopeptide repeat-containing protein [Hibiscus syriacus]
MAKCFNVVQKQKRAQRAERKRATHGDPSTKKLKNKSQSLSISGKRKRKLLKKWRRDQKEVIEKGLVTMEDVEMVAAEGTSQDANNKAPTKFHMKKNLKLNCVKRKGKKKVSKPANEASVDSMVE